MTARFPLRTLLTAVTLPVIALLVDGPAAGKESWRSIPLRSSVQGVQPMTGIVLWTTNPHAASDAIALEYSRG